MEHNRVSKECAKIDKVKNEITKLLKPYFVRLYNDIGLDISKIYRSGKILDMESITSNYKADITHILRIIYRKTFLEFGFSLREKFNHANKTELFDIPASVKGYIGYQIKSIDKDKIESIKHFKKKLNSSAMKLAKLYRDNRYYMSKYAKKRESIYNDVSRWAELEEIDVGDYFDYEATMFINNFAEEQAALISASTGRAAQEYYGRAQNEYNDNLKKIRANIDKLKTKITNLASNPATIITDSVLARIKDLREEQQLLEGRESDSLKNISKEVADNFIALWQEKVVSQKSELDIFNEVGIAESHARQLEAESVVLHGEIVEGELEGQKPIDIVKKIWDATLDGKTRFTHAGANGQEVGILEYFIVDNPKTYVPEYTLMPRGDGLSIENSINCRCNAIYILIYN